MTHSTHSNFLLAPRPRLFDPKSCEEWLQRATLADPGHACYALLTLLDEMEDALSAQPAYLKILERLRTPNFLAQEEQAKRYAGVALPLSHAESAAFAQANDLWIAMRRAYSRLWRAALDGENSELGRSIALLCQRALACTAGRIGACFFARREVDAEQWQSLHEMYAVAEANGVAETPAAVKRPQSTSAAEYARALLLQLAQPYRLSLRELAWTRRWVEYWSRKVRFTRDSPARGGYAVELGGHSGAAWVKDGVASETRRFLDLARVGRSMKKRIRRIEEGAEPAALGLGRDCTRQAAVNLLKTLGRAWFHAPAKADFPRRAAPARTELISGLAAIHHAVFGLRADSGADPLDFLHGNAEPLPVFQRAPEIALKQENPGRAPGLEYWETLEESAADFHLRRKGPGARVAHRQIVALRPHGARQFILCTVRWLFEGADHALTIGARALPGLARACAVRPVAGDPKREEPFCAALALPVAVGLPPSLVLPAGWFQSGRVVELRLDNDVNRIELLELLDRGFDYERVNFSVASMQARPR